MLREATDTPTSLMTRSASSKAFAALLLFGTLQIQSHMESRLYPNTGLLWDLFSL